MATQKIAVISKAILIMDILMPQGNEKELGVTEISKKLQMPVQSVYRLLSTLSDHGFVSQDKKTKKYKLGLSVMKYGFMMHDSLYMRSIARPYMEQLYDKTKVTIYLAKVENDAGVYVDRIDALESLIISEPIGLTLPLIVGASNRAMLAFLPQKIREAIIINGDRMVDPTLKTQRQRDLLFEIEVIRSKGYAVSYGEVTKGTIGIGAPIFSYDNSVIGSLNCTCSSNLAATSVVENYGSYVKKYAELISKELGYRNRHTNVQ
ncbi:IclR family transcriptional regulator [Cohnella abietis]|uniref:IclR family transcriptional regulator n=1 Tax=Cohnella abietis TaxID=2507935 RepID=A0A3T1D3U3_9BACL|nr:IclR family transcriptional regulator [Cohnella abietis]BBI32777.1 IclR family transcriptional regulator [Cohnella abietis]